MRTFRNILPGLLIAGTIFHTMLGAAAAEPGRFMQLRGPATAPVGHVDFCREHTAACVAHARPAVAVNRDEARWTELIAVNAEVNARIAPRTDAELSGKEEYWTYPDTGAGDCEEYALEKQRVLAARGWPKSALLITVVKDRKNEGHAVLTVRTDHGDVVLDNQIEAVLPWYSTPYRFVKR